MCFYWLHQAVTSCLTECEVAWWEFACPSLRLGLSTWKGQSRIGLCVRNELVPQVDMFKYLSLLHKWGKTDTGFDAVSAVMLMLHPSVVKNFKHESQFVDCWVYLSNSLGSSVIQEGLIMEPILLHIQRRQLTWHLTRMHSGLLIGEVIGLSYQQKAPVQTQEILEWSLLG